MIVIKVLLLIIDNNKNVSFVYVHLNEGTKNVRVSVGITVITVVIMVIMLFVYIKFLRSIRNYTFSQYRYTKTSTWGESIRRYNVHTHPAFYCTHFLLYLLVPILQGRHSVMV